MGDILRDPLNEWDVIVGAIYDSVVDPDAWRAVFAAIGRLTGAYAGVLHALDLARPGGSVLYEFNTDASWSEKYKAHYATLNPERGLVDRTRSLQAYTNDQLFGWEAYSKTQYHNEYRLPQDFGDSLNLVLDASEGRAISLSLFRRTRDPLFSPRETEALARLAPHLRRSVQIGAFVSPRDRAAEGLAAALDHLDFAALILDASGRVLHRNAGAERMAEGRVFAFTREGGLRFPRPSDAAWYAACIASAKCHRERRVLAASESGPVVATAFALGEEAAPPGLFRPLGSAAWVLFLNRAKPAGGADHRLFAEAHGLTRAELAVLSELLRGGTKIEVARALQIAESTVRGHVKQIFSKTGVRRQAELVQIATAMRTAFR